MDNAIKYGKNFAFVAFLLFCFEPKYLPLYRLKLVIVP